MNEKAKSRLIWAGIAVGVLAIAGILFAYGPAMWDEFATNPAVIGAAVIGAIATAINVATTAWTSRKNSKESQAFQTMSQKAAHDFQERIKKEEQEFELKKFRANAYFDSQRASFPRVMKAVTEFHDATRKRNSNDGATDAKTTLRRAVAKLQDEIDCEAIYLDEEGAFALDCIVVSSRRTMADYERFTLPAEEHLRLYLKLLGELFRAQLSASDTSETMLQFAVLKTMLHIERRSSYAAFQPWLTDEWAAELKAYRNEGMAATMDTLPEKSRQFGYDHPEILIACLLASSDREKIDDEPTQLLDWLCRAGGEKWRDIRKNNKEKLPSSNFGSISLECTPPGVEVPPGSRRPGPCSPA